MQESYLATEKFLAACDEMLTGKYVAAEGKIGEILKAIAAGEQLKSLFAAVTENYDFGAAKQQYLRAAEEGGSGKGFVCVPKERSEILAFVFCLLVELDGGAMELGDFLLKYFYEDGSYTASYEQFVTRLIRPFRDIVYDCFPNVGLRGEAARLRQKEESVRESLSSAIPAECQRIAALELREEDKVAGDLILSELIAATGRGDRSEIRALLCGYFYFLKGVGAKSGESDGIFAIAEEL